jgi:hypothetical protein
MDQESTCNPCLGIVAEGALRGRQAAVRPSQLVHTSSRADL